MHRIFGLLTLATMVLSAAASFAQTTIVSSEGDGVFRAPGPPKPGETPFTSMLTFKSDDTSVRLSFATPTESGTAGQITYGADVTAKSSQGLAAVLKNGTYTPGTKINGYVLRHSLFTDVKSGNSVDWVVLQGSLAITQLALFDASRAFSDQLTKPTFVGLGAKGTYAFEYAGWLLLGGTGGIERANNYSDLKDVVVSNQTTYTDTVSGSTRAVNSDQTSAKKGTYVEGNVGIARADVLLYPSNWASGRVGVTFYENNRFSSNALLRRYDVGIGLALLKKASPTIALGSIIVELKDFSNSQGSTASLGRRVTASLQGSVPIAPKFGF